MPLDVYLDNNVWDLLFDQGIDICEALPASHYRLWVTREAEFEISALEARRDGLATFVGDALSRCVQVNSRFGFYDPRHSNEEQRSGGFDVGGFVSVTEYEFEKKHRSSLSARKKPTTHLYSNEADVALASRSFDAVVLTMDTRGPLRKAHSQGGNVVFLTSFVGSGLSLDDFLKARLPSDLFEE